MVSKVMCGEEQIWPQNKGITFNICLMDTIDGVYEERRYTVNLQKDIVPDNIPGVMVSYIATDGATWLIFNSPSQDAVNAMARNVEHADSTVWRFEWDMYVQTFMVRVDPYVFEQTEYTSQSVDVEFTHEMHQLEISARINVPEYGDEAYMEVSPDVVQKNYDGYYNTYTAKSLGGLGHVKIYHGYYGRYDLTSIIVLGMNPDEYIIHLDEEYVELLPSAFMRFHEEGIQITWTYDSYPMYYINFKETYKRDGHDDFIDEYHGNVHIENNIPVCWFDKTPPAGYYYCIENGDYVHMYVPDPLPDGTYYTISNFINLTPDEQIGFTSSYIRIPKSYLVPSPGMSDLCRLEWTLTEHRP